MNLQIFRNGMGALVAAAMLMAGGTAYAQADNTNSFTDPTLNGSWYYWNPTPAARYWRDVDYAYPRWYAYGPTVTHRERAYYDSRRYYDAPVRYYSSPSVTPLGTVVEPGYLGPHNAKP